MKQEIKVYALPTEKASRLHKVNNKFVLWHCDIIPTNEDCINHHLYATTSETPKKGDYCIEEISCGLFGPYEEGDIVLNPRKVVATDDTDLLEIIVISDGKKSITKTMIKLISPEFQQAWVREANKDTPIVDAMTEMEYTGGNDGVCGYVDNTVKCLCGGDGINKCYAKSAIQPKLNPQGYVTILPVKEKIFTRQEVIDILVSVFLFSGSNNNQGLLFVKGNNYGEQAETIIKANENVEGTNKSMISIIANFK